jgi:molecular chaperone GrpE
MDETSDRNETRAEPTSDEAATANAAAPREAGPSGDDAGPGNDGGSPPSRDQEEGEEPAFRVVDRRHAHAEEDDDAVSDAEIADEPAEATGPYPTIVEELRGRAESAETQLRDYIAAYKKERDEMDAFRKRLREGEAARARQALGSSLGRFLEVVDNLDRALAHAAEDDPLRDGVQQTRTMLLRILKDEGVELLEPEGERFDPEVAEAVMMRDAPADQDGHVVEVLRSGYVFDGKVLRAAQVVVGRKTSG